MNEKWSKAEDAPIDTQVLVWIAPVMMAGSVQAHPARMEVGTMRKTNARSKKITLLYRRDAMWMPLPKGPR